MKSIAHCAGSLLGDSAGVSPVGAKKPKLSTNLPIYDKQSIRTLLAVRQKLVGRRLIDLLSVYPSFGIVEVARSVDEIRKNIALHSPEILFLDLDLSREVIPEMMSILSSGVKIVLLASDENFAFKAFEIGAVDYLLKPVSTERFHLTAMRILAGRGAGADLPSPALPFDPSAGVVSRFLVPADHRGKKAEWVSYSQIGWIQAEQNYTRVQLLGGTAHLMKRTLTEWEMRLPTGDFIRLGRSLIIQLKHLRTIERKTRDMTALRFDEIETVLHIGREAVFRLRGMIGGR